MITNFHVKERSEDCRSRSLKVLNGPAQAKDCEDEERSIVVTSKTERKNTNLGVVVHFLGVVVVAAVLAQRTGWWLNHSFEKYIRQIEIISPFQVKMTTKYWETPPTPDLFILSNLKTKAKYEESIITNFNHTFEKHIIKLSSWHFPKYLEETTILKSKKNAPTQYQLVVQPL